MNIEDQIKLFELNNLSIEAEIRKTEKDLGIPFREAAPNEDRDEEYYPQFPEHIRHEAEAMARHYEIFYCLETSIRQLIMERLKEEAGSDWWNKCVPEQIKKNAEDNRKRESEMAMTPRSDNMIDFTTFGELGQIIGSNGKIFGDTFRDLKAVSRVLTSLNSLRGPIAHCCPLAEDEVSRLGISLKDWFRQMG
jgi:Swt1-like HEPN